LMSEMASCVTSMPIHSRSSFSAASIVVPQPQNGSSTVSRLDILDKFLNGRTGCVMKSIKVIFANESSPVVCSKVSEEFQIGQNSFCIPSQSELGFRSRFSNQLGEINVIAIALDSVSDCMMFKSLDNQ